MPTQNFRRRWCPFGTRATVWLTSPSVRTVATWLWRMRIDRCVCTGPLAAGQRSTGFWRKFLRKISSNRLMWKSIINQLSLQVLDYDSLGTVLSAAPFFLLTGSDANAFLCATSRYAHRPNDKNFPMEWMYSAKHKSHWRPIVGLCFAVPEPGKQQRLFSVGEDRRLVEYSVKSSEFGGLQVGMKPKHSIVFWGKQSSLFSVKHYATMLWEKT